MTKKANYQICSRCVMDNASDDTIRFDSDGCCNYCNDAISKRPLLYFPNQEGQEKLGKMLRILKSAGKGRKYDCLMGLSGGLDSSYLAYLGAKKWGLRILAIHIDDGYDTPLAQKNIENLCKACNIELIVISPDSDQFNDLTRSYFLAEVPNVAIPQDNVLFAALYESARLNGIRYFLSGSNYALESILQKGNTHDAFDMVNLKDIHSKFGTLQLDKLPLLSNRQKRLDLYVRNIQTFRPLNYIDYNKTNAINELSEFCGFEYYKAKHLENTLTKVIQLYWFYEKFNVDKRRSHLSSLIVSNQITRDEALVELSQPVYEIEELNKDIHFVLSKLNLSFDAFKELIHKEGKQHEQYKTEPPLSYISKLSWGIIHKLSQIIRFAMVF